MAHMIDPTVTGNYPVILGEGLLSNTPNEIFTGIRYNHKPALTSDARLKPSVPGKTASYDLAFHDAKSGHAFSGTRTTENDDYVLYFDAQRKAFVLDKVDSTFNMNITRVPGNSNAEDLRRQYPHLAKPRPLPLPKKALDKEKLKPPEPTSASDANAAAKINGGPVRPRKAEKKQQKKLDLALPTPAPAPQREEGKQGGGGKRGSEVEEEEDDDDGGLLVEYPGAESAGKTDFSPAFPVPRRFDDFMDQRESEADDADGESDEEADTFKLPSPVQNHAQSQNQSQQHESLEIDEAELEAAFEDASREAGNLEDDLEKEMEMAFDDLRNSQDGSPGDESEISEED